MKRNKIIRGTLPPLFDRIVTDRTGEGIETHLLNAQQLKDSIIQEVSTILNTRCTVRKVIYKDHMVTIPLFGMPDFFGLGDFSYFDASNSQDWSLAASYLESAIRAAEPRLKNIVVAIDNYDSVNQTLFVTVSADLKDNKLLKEIHFPLSLTQLKPSTRQAAA